MSLMEVGELFRFNEWWETGRVSDRYLAKYHRPLFYNLLDFIPDRQALLVSGLRRIGKTTMLYQLIHHFLEQGTDPRKILYFSFDEAAFDLKDVLETYGREVLRTEFKDAGRIFVFFDEVQKVSDWENKIKVYYDLNPNVKFFLSGSASLLLSGGAKESLAGRAYEFVMPPLKFREFLELKGMAPRFEDARLLNEKMLLHFLDFLRKAGFPELADEGDDRKIRDYVRLSIVERIIYRDIPTQFGPVDVELLRSLSELFFKNPGFILNFDKLSKDMRRDKKTIMNYVHYLNLSLLVRLVSNFRISALAASRKARKAYPATTSIAFSFSGGFGGQSLGKALETIFCCEADAAHYYRKGGKEIDFLLMGENRMVPVEIKTEPSEGDEMSFASLLRKLGLKKGLLLTLQRFGRVSSGDAAVLVFPLWVFLVFPGEVFKELENAG